jgi:hypothetical protein
LAQKSSQKSVDNFRAKLTDLRDNVIVLEEENKRLGQATLSWMELLQMIRETETARAQADYWMNAFSHIEEKRQGKGTCMQVLVVIQYRGAMMRVVDGDKHQSPGFYTKEDKKFQKKIYKDESKDLILRFSALACWVLGTDFRSASLS